MDRRQNSLIAKDLPNLPSGWHSDGGGLYLVVSDKGHRAWIYRATVPGTRKRQEDKLGNLADMTLGEARRMRDRRRDDAKAAHASGVTPRAPRLDRGMTVKAVAELWIDNCNGTGRWKSLTYPAQVRQRLRDYVYPIIGHQPIATLNHDMICEVLERPGTGADTRTFWVRLPTSADLVRRLLAEIVNFAAAKGYRSRDLANPAAWDRLQYLYPATTAIHTVTHHAAVEPEDAPALMAKIKSDQLIPAKALAYVLLTAVRISDLFGSGREKSEPLKWKHLDEQKRNWHVPMTKKSKPLTVPLSDQAWAILMEMKVLQGGNPKPDDRVFPRSRRTLRNVLVRAGVIGEQSVHGTRALFASWAKNIDDDGEPLKRDLIDAALCHKFESETQAEHSWKKDAR